MGITRRDTAAPTASNYAAPQTDEAFADEDENDKPARSSSVSRRGWGSAKKVVEQHSKGFAKTFKVPEEDTLIKFLEDEPFYSGASHWVDEITEGKRSFTCLEKGCPLCGVGHAARAEVHFNVVPIEEGDPTVVSLIAGPMLTDLIRAENEGRGGPLSRHYWKIRKSGGGKKGRVSYTLSVVKERDMAEDWGLDPAEVKSSLADLKPFDESTIFKNTAEELDEIVDKHLTN